ncbi:hypothetical protein [Hallella mizrahii]|uniref:Uncharacterized protein n=1 Tax=Hallella mizrahii TaxID=2606637 RepID=A0A7K0KC48_9BACT|nr:hypothetical protein [Hallella mizrahii]MST83494.1 hypothetical protein [Hallella mizrahii]
MKAIYMKPSLKIKEIDAAESMLTGSRGNNLTPTGESYTGIIGTTENTPQVSGTSALSKQGSFPGNQWEEEE